MPYLKASELVELGGRGDNRTVPVSYFRITKL